MWRQVRGEGRKQGLRGGNFAKKGSKGVRKKERKKSRRRDHNDRRNKKESGKLTD